MSSYISRLFHRRVVRFGVVGALNTLIHFTILNVCYNFLQFGKLASSLVATVCAITMSFILNRRIVFNVRTSRLVRQAILFVAVTITGMLLIHNTVYIIMTNLLSPIEPYISHLLQDLVGISPRNDVVGINVATMIGAAVTMVWNYIAYRWIVFLPENSQDEKTT